MGRVIRILGGGSGGSGTGWDGQVEFRADLPVTIGIPAIGEVWLVEKPTKVLGITIYQSGLYIKDSDTGSLSDWRRLNIAVTIYNSDNEINSNRNVGGGTSRFSMAFNELTTFFAQSKGAGAGGEETSMLLFQNEFDLTFGGQGFLEGSAIKFIGDVANPEIQIITHLGGGGVQTSVLRFPDASASHLWLLQNGSGTLAFLSDIGLPALKTKSGIVLAGAFSGFPKKTAPIVFATPFPTGNYAITLTAHTQNNTTFSIDYESRINTGFIINSHANFIGNLIDVTWIATEIGEN